jgi:hypothetical protein
VFSSICFPRRQTTKEQKITEIGSEMGASRIRVPFLNAEEAFEGLVVAHRNNVQTIPRNFRRVLLFSAASELVCVVLSVANLLHLSS